MFDSNRRAIAPRKHPGRSWLSPDEGWPGVGQEGWATRIWATAGCEECTLGSVKAEQPGGIWCTPLLERYPIGPGKEHGRREAHTHAACPGCVCARACVLAQVCVSVCSMPRPRVVGPAGPPEHNYVSTGRVRVRAECSLCCPGSATVPAAPDEGGKVCRVRHACSLSPLSLAHAEALVGYPQSVIPFRPPPPPPPPQKNPTQCGPIRCTALVAIHTQANAHAPLPAACNLSHPSCTSLCVFTSGTPSPQGLRLCLFNSSPQ